MSHPLISLIESNMQGEGKIRMNREELIIEFENMTVSIKGRAIDTFVSPSKAVENPEPAETVDSWTATESVTVGGIGDVTEHVRRSRGSDELHSVRAHRRKKYQQRVFTKEQFEQMASLKAGGLTVREIGARFGVSHTLIVRHLRDMKYMQMAREYAELKGKP